MNADQLKDALIWCVAIDFGVLFVWFGAFVFAHDWMYRLHTRWFKLSVETFDAVTYSGIALFKMATILFFLVPLIALLLA